MVGGKCLPVPGIEKALEKRWLPLLLFIINTTEHIAPDF